MSGHLTISPASCMVLYLVGLGIVQGGLFSQAVSLRKADFSPVSHYLIASVSGWAPIGCSAPGFCYEVMKYGGSVQFSGVVIRQGLSKFCT